MTSTAAGPETDAAIFELERFDWAGDGRLEVSGRWYGLRARRFVRPSLVLQGKGAGRRLLAVLDHKPWMADEGEPWTAAFAADGDIEVEAAELSVAPGIDVRLPAPGPAAKGKRRQRRFRSHSAEAPPADNAGEPTLKAEAERTLAAADPPEAEPRTARDAARLAELARERDAAVAARDAAEGERRIAEQELASARESLQAALRDGRAREREAEATGERRLADLRERFQRDIRILKVAEEDALRERDRAQRERDKAAGARDKAAAERDKLKAERDGLKRERDELAAAAGALPGRDRRAVARLGPPRAWADPPPSVFEVWMPRLVGAAILAIFMGVIALLLGAT